MHPLRDQIQQTNDSPIERAWIPEWTTTVWVRPLTGKERDAFEVQQSTSRENTRARLAVLCTVDDKGQNIFTAEDAAWVGLKSAKALDRIFDIAVRLSGFTADDVEAIEKKSETAPGGSSS